jgi:hypothetical protein
MTSEYDVIEHKGTAHAAVPLEDLSAMFAKLATPELIALGEAAVTYGRLHGEQADPSDLWKADADLLEAARAYAASVASIPTTPGGR